MYLTRPGMYCTGSGHKLRHDFKFIKNERNLKGNIGVNIVDADYKEVVEK